jgi:hypothetical protein
MHNLKVGDHVQASLSGGRAVDATVMAVINETDGTRLQVSFGHETALIYLWQVGDPVLVKLPGGRIVEATIKALVDTTEGTRLQVDFGYDETALIYDRQVVKEGV